MNFSIFPPKILPPKKIKYHYENPVAPGGLSNFLSELLSRLNPDGKKEILVMCVGTDRSTGDCLGPLVGWQLSQRNIDLPVYGTLDDPIHASNLSEKLNMVKKTHGDPIIIAVDACLGRLENVGMINLGEGSLKPGAGVHKNLPHVGNIYFTGIVNVGGYMEYIVLQNTRLSVVMRIASVISQSIIHSVKKFSRIQEQRKKEL